MGNLIPTDCAWTAASIPHSVKDDDEDESLEQDLGIISMGCKSLKGLICNRELHGADDVDSVKVLSR